MSHDPHLDHLAGATLDNVTVHWRNGIALVSFLPSGEMMEGYAIRAEGLRRLEIARGATNARVVKGASHVTKHHLEVLMDNGEKLIVEADTITLVGNGG
jgi:hypothetical protein